MKSTADIVIFGVHSVSQLLHDEPQRVTALYLQDGREDAVFLRLQDLALARSVRVERLPKQRLSELVGDARHQGVAATISTVPPLDERGLERLLEDVESPLLLALDGVQDPHNLGACLRSAAAAGVHAVIIPKNRAVGLTGAVRKVASGAADAVPVAQVTNLARSLSLLRKRNVWCYGAAANEGRELYDLDLQGPLCLVLGGEADGLRRLTRERCDELFSIPMQGDVESLNVSVAAGICLFEAVRQRRPQ